MRYLISYRGGLLSRLTVNFQHLKCTSDRPVAELQPSNRRPFWLTPLRVMSSSIQAPGAAGGGGNRLRLEKSPYLLQHAHNPINWFPFGPEAISKAKDEDKLIFLSVGYATCHWCHVMEHESFMSTEIAEIMNEHFVSIKVDREERPDIDKIYMAFLLMINRSGGWPMNVWLTPDLTPITAGTYFPPESRWGVPGFKSVLLHIADKWERERESLLTTGQSVIKILQKSVDGEATEDGGTTIAGKFDEAVQIFKYSFDKDWGGFNGAPKFPEASKLNFLLHAYLLKQDKELLNVVTKTLQRIAHGGIHDHVFGGFSRYAVDRKWHVPHFEKMLYDQAQLMTVFANTFKVTRDPFYLSICEKTFEYLTTDLCHPTGGFYSGLDADSYPMAQSQQKIEGAFYAWTYEEIRERFETGRSRFPETAEPDLPFQLFCDHFDVQEGGNVTTDNDPHGHFVGKNILFAKDPVEETQKRYVGVNVQEVLRVGCEVLNEERQLRPRPELDTKLICSWNGLVLAGLSQLVSISEGAKRERYLAQGQKLMDFIRANFYNAEHKTLRRSCYGDADSLAAECRFIPGFLDDYAFLIRGLLAFYLVSMDNAVLVWTKTLQETQDRLFFDEENGGYYYTQEGSEHVVVRLKEDHDGAEPCGNSVSITNLLQLGTYFEDKRHKAIARKCIHFFKSNGSLGYAMPELLSGALLFEHGLDMLVVVGPKVPATENLLKVAQLAYAPGMVAFHLQTDNPESVLRESVKSFKMVNNSPTVYLCHNKVCQLPITDARKLEETLESRFEATN